MTQKITYWCDLCGETIASEDIDQLRGRTNSASVPARILKLDIITPAWLKPRKLPDGRLLGATRTNRYTGGAAFHSEVSLEHVCTSCAWTVLDSMGLRFRPPPKPSKA